jgi:hypothetical protein
VKNHYALEFGRSEDEDRLMRCAPLDDEPLRLLPVMDPSLMIDWVKLNHSDGPKCPFGVFSRRVQACLLTGCTKRAVCLLQV